MTVPSFSFLPTPQQAYDELHYHFDTLELTPVIRIPVQGPAPYNTLVVVQGRVMLTPYAIADGNLHPRTVPIGTGLRLAHFDPDDPRQRQVRHSSSAVIRMMQTTEQSDVPGDDDNTAFVLAVDRVHGESKVDDYGFWSLTLDVAHSFWQVYAAAYAEITSWVLCYEAPPSPGQPSDPPQPVHALALEAPALLATYRSYAAMPHADIFKAAGELTQLDRQLSIAGLITLAAEAEQTAVDILASFTPDGGDRATYLVTLAHARHNLIARLVEDHRPEQVPVLAPLTIDGYLAYTRLPNADLTTTVKDLAELVKPLLAAGDPGHALAAQQATLDVLERIEPSESDRLEHQIQVIEARHNVIARLIDAHQPDRAAAMGPAVILAYLEYARTAGADIARAVRDLNDLATTVFTPAGLTDQATAAQEAAHALNTGSRDSEGEGGATRGGSSRG